MELLDKLIAAARVFSREEYFAMTIEAIQEAKKSIWGVVTGSRPRASDLRAVERILQAIKYASKRGVDVKYLLPIGREKLYMGYRYTSAGAMIKYCPGLLVSDARYMIVDNKLVVLGFPERHGEREPTRRGQRIYSEAIASLFAKEFESCWSSATTMTFNDYLESVITEILRSNPEASIERISEDLKLPIRVIYPKVKEVEAKLRSSS